MKKFLLSMITLVLLGSATKVNAQCQGVQVTFSNIFSTETPTHYVYQFNWFYVSGNASIQARFECGGNENYVLDGPCIPWVKDSINPPTPQGYFFKDSFSKADIAAIPSCGVGTKKIIIGVWTSNACGGKFCPNANNEIILPVEFKSFTAKRVRSNVGLVWETASEQNSAGFFVQRNAGGKWEDIAYVPSKAQNGNSSSDLSYDYNDLNTVKGISQYRIMQVDLDGKSKYSDTRAVRGEGQIGKTTIFPNPSNNGNVTIMFDDVNVKRDVSVIDMAGKVIKQWRNVTNNNLQVENLPMGVFSVRILAVETGEQVVEKIVVNKR